MKYKHQYKRTYQKKHLIQVVAKQFNIRIRDATQWVNSVISALRELLMSSDDEFRIEIRDFGVFEVKQTREKPKARNPRTGVVIYVPQRKKIHFKPGKILRKYLVNSSK